MDLNKLSNNDDTLSIYSANNPGNVWDRHKRPQNAIIKSTASIWRPMEQIPQTPEFKGDAPTLSHVLITLGSAAIVTKVLLPAIYKRIPTSTEILDKVNNIAIIACGLFLAAAYILCVKDKYNEEKFNDAIALKEKTRINEIVNRKISNEEVFKTSKLTFHPNAKSHSSHTLAVKPPKPPKES